MIFPTEIAIMPRYTRWYTLLADTHVSNCTGKNLDGRPALGRRFFPGLLRQGYSVDARQTQWTQSWHGHGGW